MGFMDKAKQLAEQAQQKLDEAQKKFNQGGSTPGQAGRAGAELRRARAPGRGQRRPRRRPSARARRSRPRPPRRRAARRRPSPPRSSRPPSRPPPRSRAAAAAASSRPTSARTPLPTRSSRSSSDRRHPHRDGHAVRRGRGARRGRRRPAHPSPARQRLGRARARRHAPARRPRSPTRRRPASGSSASPRRGDATVIAGTGTYDTRHSVELTERATRDRASTRVLVVTPYYVRPTGAGSRPTTRRSPAATDLPVVVYNIPSRTATDMPNDLLAELAEIENVVAVKQARYEDIDADRRARPARGQRRRASPRRWISAARAASWSPRTWSAARCAGSSTSPSAATRSRTGCATSSRR